MYTDLNSGRRQMPYIFGALPVLLCTSVTRMDNVDNNIGELNVYQLLSC